MKAMSSYISAGSNAHMLSKVCVDEIEDHFQQLPSYGEQDWSQSEKQRVINVLQDEKERISLCADLSRVADSVKGETAMEAVYQHTGKAADIITLQTSLYLTELKYLIKVGGLGPFGGPGSFRKRIADKFLAMYGVLTHDGEVVNPLRIIVATEEQYPYSLAHVHGLLDSQYPSGSFSSDNKIYSYALCTSVFLRGVVDGVIQPHQSGVDCFFFSI